MVTTCSQLKRLGIISCLLVILTPTTFFATTNDPTILHLGILAPEGKEQCYTMWNPTELHLRQALPGYRTNIVCLDFEEIERAADEAWVDFTISNPAVYINLEYKYGASRIATRKGLGQGDSATRFGGVIFTRSGRDDITSLADLRGKRLAAVDKTSFGGWLVNAHHLQQAGLNLAKDFAELNFVGQHQEVVLTVLQGRADAGVVRTGTLEQMTYAGIITGDAYTVLDEHPATANFPYVRSTILYPEWALAKMRHTNTELAEQVMHAFLHIKAPSMAATAARLQGWTIPLEYYPVHQVLRELKIGPYLYLNQPLSVGDFFRQYRLWVLGGTAVFLLVLGSLLVSFFLNQKLARTSRKLRDEHQQREQTLADLNEFKTTLDKVHDCVFMLDPETLRFVYVNQGALDQVGYTHEEMARLTPLEIKPDTNETEFRAMLATLQLTAAKALTFETQHRRKDGSFLPVEVFLQYITPEGKKGRYVAIVRDISQRLAQRKEREELLARLNTEQKLASIGQLAAGLAHEINTPAQYLESNIDFLRESFAAISQLINSYDQLVSVIDVQNPGKELAASCRALQESADWKYLAEEIPRALDQSREGVTRISSIVLAMKEFSRPGCNEKQAVDVNALLDTTITVAGGQWRDITDIDRRFDPDQPTVWGLPTELGQVMLNILINAAQAIEDKIAAEPNAERGKITIVTAQVGEQVEIAITDNGGGMSEENAAKVFEPFFTTKEVGRGTGQGLALCYDIVVHKHGGSIDFVSKLGEGTTFIVRLNDNPAPVVRK